MKVRLQIAAMVFLMVQAGLFGVGVLLVLATPLQNMAMTLVPAVVIGSSLISAPLSWIIAPRLRARYWRVHREDVISGPARAA